VRTLCGFSQRATTFGNRYRLGKPDVDSIRKARLRVAVAAVNGTAGGLIGEFLRFLGCTPILINDEPAASSGRRSAKAT
jgi:phosphomannomutase